MAGGREGRMGERMRENEREKEIQIETERDSERWIYFPSGLPFPL